MGRPYDVKNLIYDWNAQGEAKLPAQVPEILDETLRDGLQSTTVKMPATEEKKQLVRLMCDLKIDAVNLGYPAATPGMYQDSFELARMLRDEKLPILPYCLGRTLIQDIKPMVEISQKLGFAVHAFLFIGSSPIRQFVEEWGLEVLLLRTREAVSYSVKERLPTMFFTEDTTRSHWEVLKALWETAIECGTTRIGLADTAGHANPKGTKALVQHARSIIAATGKKVKIDWHSHSDRGLSTANSLAALDAGADRVHGCALGIGERVGNTSMEQLLVNLKLDGYPGFQDRNFTKLRDYVNLASKICGVAIPPDYPVVGSNAFKTSTGIHAAAIIKAHGIGSEWLANRVYSSVPAEEIGLRQRIEVGPQSGRSNVVYWLTHHGFQQYKDDERIISGILEAVKQKDRVLSEEELKNLIATAAAKETHPPTKAALESKSKQGVEAKS